MALSSGPASTVSYVSCVQPVPLSVPTARASPFHGDQSQTHSFPGEQCKGLSMPCHYSVETCLQCHPHQDVSSYPLSNSLSYCFFLPYHVLPTVSRYSQKTFEVPPNPLPVPWAGGMFLVPPVLTLLWPGQWEVIPCQSTL